MYYGMSSGQHCIIGLRTACPPLHYSQLSKPQLGRLVHIYSLLVIGQWGYETRAPIGLITLFKLVDLNIGRDCLNRNTKCNARELLLTWWTGIKAWISNYIHWFKQTAVEDIRYEWVITSHLFIRYNQIFMPWTQYWFWLTLLVKQRQIS